MITAPVNPPMLVWARETRGYSVEVAAKKVQVKPERLLEWETGTRQPSIAQTEALADAYKRPLAVFYLDKAPETPPRVRDFRSGSTSRRAKEATTPSLLLAERLAHFRRNAALVLADELRADPPRFGIRASIDSTASTIAAAIRRVLGVSVTTQHAWRQPRVAFNEWRAALEDKLGVLVFHADRVEPSEARGFSIYADEFPVVVVNGYDSWAGRTFTLFHELAHLTLREGGVCLLDETPGVETWCNHVAAAVLMPSEAIRSDVTDDTRWTPARVDDLAKGYGVSPQAALIRLIDLNVVAPEAYARRAAEFRHRQRAAAHEKAKGGPPPDVMALRRSGPRFTRLVLDALHSERITTADASQYLGLGVSHFEALEATVARGE